MRLSLLPRDLVGLVVSYVSWGRMRHVQLLWGEWGRLEGEGGAWTRRRAHGAKIWTVVMKWTSLIGI